MLLPVKLGLSIKDPGGGRIDVRTLPSATLAQGMSPNEVASVLRRMHWSYPVLAKPRTS